MGRKKKYATNPANAEMLAKEIKKRFSKREYFTPANLTHDNVCGFKFVKTLKPFLETLVEQGIIEKGDREKRFKVNNKKATVEHDTREIKEEKEDISNTFNEKCLPAMSEISDVLKSYKRFVITTAVSKKRVNSNYLKSMKNYAQRNNAAILVLPSDIGNSNRNGKSILELDKALLTGCHIIYKDVFLNNNLCICSIKTSAKQIKTLTGLDRIATRKNASIIVASTKQFMHYIPSKMYDTPLAIMTTGAITSSNYDTDAYMSKRTSYLAEEDHKLGAVIVEIENENIFHFRHTTATKEGTFTDLGVEYNPDGTAKVLSNSILVLGDSHTEQLNNDLHPFILDFINKMNVGTIVLHDAFNSTSITHHDKGKLLTRAIKANDARNSIKQEGFNLASYLISIKENVSKVVVVNSNHDRHIESYLEEGRFMTDPINTEVGLELSLAYIRGHNPLKYLIENIVGYSDSNIKWLKQDEGYKRYGVELGFHGSEGACGARGSIATYDKCIGNCVIGHSHSGQIMRDTYCVGTVANLNQSYNHGLSNWSVTNCLVTSNGVKQLINFIATDNRYKFTIS